MISVFVKMRDWRRVKERSWWWIVLYSDALMSGYGSLNIHPPI